jgi:hypothetical protein
MQSVRRRPSKAWFCKRRKQVEQKHKRNSSNCYCVICCAKYADSSFDRCALCKRLVLLHSECSCFTMYLCRKYFVESIRPIREKLNRILPFAKGYDGISFIDTHTKEEVLKQYAHTNESLTEYYKLVADEQVLIQQVLWANPLNISSLTNNSMTMTKFLFPLDSMDNVCKVTRFELRRGFDETVKYLHLDEILMEIDADIFFKYWTCLHADINFKIQQFANLGFVSNDCWSIVLSYCNACIFSMVYELQKHVKLHPQKMQFRCFCIQFIHEFVKSH